MMQYLQVFEAYQAYTELTEAEFTPTVLTRAHWDNIIPDQSLITKVVTTLLPVTQTRYHYTTHLKSNLLSRGSKNSHIVYLCLTLYHYSAFETVVVDLKLNIYKLQDEWYYLSIQDMDRARASYYKCDQFDGLVACLQSVPL